MEQEFLISVPRKCLSEFYNKYLNLVETFYYVKLTEKESPMGLFHCESPYYAYFQVAFNVNPADAHFNPRDIVTRIQKYVESGLGWAGERAEDSSYDSECEEESAHRAASRTPSDTLAAEFAEYVTIAQPTRPNQSKIDFAVKLGYTEAMALTAFQKLGPDPSQNELLAELIKLAAMCPPRPLTPPTIEPETSVIPASPHRHIVIDGSNVAMSHGNKEIFSCKGIEICVEWFRSRGHRDITVFVPKWRKEPSRPDNPVTDRDILDRLEKERVLVYTPSRLLGGKRLICYDDRYILRLAAETDGIVVSNDNYRDLAIESPEFRKVIEERLLMFSFVNDRFMPPDDPLGRSGPTLDAFLRAPSSRAQPPLCPYGRKCTYGNKCKYNHPERAGKPHKFVAEKLSERAARILHGRGLHTLSLPPGGRPPDNKKPLSRAHSATPRLADTALSTHFDRAQLQPHQPDDNNQHRKLARQLTLNPACDPRLSRAAPQGSMVMHSGMYGAGAHGSGKHGASSHGTNVRGHVPLSMSVSEGGGLQQWEARSRMVYHLSGIFPEAQVAEAMAMYPNETDAQKMCAIILARYRPCEPLLSNLSPF